MADSRIPELIADLEDQACACLLAHVPQISRPTAIQISKQLSRHITDNWRGQIIYSPKTQAASGRARPADLGGI